MSTLPAEFYFTSNGELMHVRTTNDAVPTTSATLSNFEDNQMNSGRYLLTSMTSQPENQFSAGQLLQLYPSHFFVEAGPSTHDQSSNISRSEFNYELAQHFQVSNHCTMSQFPGNFCSAPNPIAESIEWLPPRPPPSVTAPSTGATRGTESRGRSASKKAVEGGRSHRTVSKSNGHSVPSSTVTSANVRRILAKPPKQSKLANALGLVMDYEDFNEREDLPGQSLDFVIDGRAPNRFVQVNGEIVEMESPGFSVAKFWNMQSDTPVRQRHRAGLRNEPASGYTVVSLCSGNASVGMRYHGNRGENQIFNLGDANGITQSCEIVWSAEAGKFIPG